MLAENGAIQTVYDLERSGGLRHGRAHRNPRSQPRHGMLRG